MRHFPELHARSTAQTSAKAGRSPFSRAAPHSTPLIEVLLPAFDDAAAVERTLASLAGQSWINWALTARDDGSRDCGPELLLRFADAFPDRPINVTGGPHLGPERAGVTLLAQAGPLTDVAVLVPAGARLASDFLARTVRLATSGDNSGACLWLLAAGRAGRAFREVSVEDVLHGRISRRTGIVANRAAIDLLRLAAPYRGPIPDVAAWAAGLISGAGGTVLAGSSPDLRLPMRARAGLRMRRPSADSATQLRHALRSVGPLLLPAARRALDADAPRSRFGRIARRGWLRGAPAS